MDISILYASAAALLAGFIDSIVGGGGLVQVPSLFILYPQFSVPQVVGTNRFASFLGTSMAGYQYAKKVTVPWRVVVIAGICAAVMAYLGATFASLVKAEVLKPIILLLMSAIAIYTFSNKTLGQNEKPALLAKHLTIYAVLIGSLSGFYNGFVGPGTGSLLVFGFVSIIGFGFLKASATSKIVNVISDIASLVFFIWQGYVQFKIAIPMMFCNIVGSFFGSRMAILKGNGFVRTFFLCVISALILRFGYDIFRLI
jgi:uncharacterized protein